MQDSHRSALLFALLGFALLSVGDILVKGMAGLWPGIALAALRYVFGALGLGVTLGMREGRSGFRFPEPRWQLIRGLSVGTSAISFFSAVQLMPIGEATALSFTSPMITALLAAVILKEPLRKETWIASGIAFAGMLMILRPNFSELGIVALLPLISATCMALLIIANRKVAGKSSALSMQFSVAFVGMIFLLTAATLAHFSGIPRLAIVTPPAIVVAKCAFIAFSASFAHAFIYMATTRAGAATIAPMTYVQLLMAGGFGWLLFSERPDAMTALGAVAIVSAGLYLWRSGRGPAEPVTTD